jgi:glyoxylase-like metal-dependent hydrolase (beta-lactamase superfamily II)
MNLITISPNLHQLSLGFVSVYLLECDDGLTLVDTGIPGSDSQILAAVASLGKRPEQIKRIVLTHLHGDHTGSLFALKDATGAEVCAHSQEAAAIRLGQTMRAVKPAPGLLNQLIVRLLVQRQKPSLQMPVAVERELQDDDELPGGWRVIHTPGHTAGHIVLWRPLDGGVLLVGDAASNMLHLGNSMLFEDFELGTRSLQKIARLDFEIACFSHGKPITHGAADKFRQKWTSVV